MQWILRIIKKHIGICWCQAENIIKSRRYNTTLLKLLTPIELGAKDT